MPDEMGYRRRSKMWSAVALLGLMLADQSANARSSGIEHAPVAAEEKPDKPSLGFDLKEVYDRGPCQSICTTLLVLQVVRSSNCR